MQTEPNASDADDGPKKSILGRIAAELDNATAVMVFLGVLLYAALRLYADSFYSRFDATPEEAGLTYLSILTRAALGFAFVAFLFAVVAGLFYGLPAFVGRLRSGSESAPERDIQVGTNDKRNTAIGGIVLGIALTAIGFHERDTVLMLMGLLLLVMLAALLLDDWTPDPDGPEHLRPVMLAVLGGAAAVAVLITAGISGTWHAEIVASGQEFEGNSYFGLGAVRADCVTVTWIGGKPPTGLDLSEPFLFLGQADGEVLLTQGADDVTRDGGQPTWRLPTSSIVLYGVEAGAVGQCPAPT